MAVIYHDEHVADRVVMLAMRSMLAISGKPAQTPETRAAFDELVARVPSPEHVTYEAGRVGGVEGWWCRPNSDNSRAAILYLHGGAYVMGTASAFRHFVGQLATRACVAAFVPDYALAPERPFPAAFEEAAVVLETLRLEFDRVAVCGDSAGGGLTLALLSRIGASNAGVAASVVFSPWIDLALSGESMRTRASHDPLVSRETLRPAVDYYLKGADPEDPRANALKGDMPAVPPVRIHVGRDEVLLDDSLRFAARMEAAGQHCEVHVWKGMTHVFPRTTALQAAGEALDDAGAFLRVSLERTT